MSKLEIVLGILAFALVTAVLYVWGLRRSLTQQADLEQLLLQKSARRVVHYLRQHGSVSLTEMEALCAGVQAGQFWSRRRAAVQDPGAFARKLAQYMTGQLLIREAPGGRFVRR